MAIQHLLTLANRSRRPCQSLGATLLSHVRKSNSPYSTLADDNFVPLTRVTTLPSGLRVGTESNFSSDTAIVGVWIDAGSGIESLKTSGTGFFLKRMLVKGTETRTERQLEEEIENLRGYFRAYSNKENTYFYAQVMDKEVPQALDILSDIVQNPNIKKRKIESERHEILRYIKELEEETEEAIVDHLHATAFPDSPLGRTVVGPAENVKTITKKELRNYMSSHYTAPRMVIAACGAVKHEEIVEQVKSLFTKLPEGSTTTPEVAAKDKTIFTPSEVRIYDDNVPLAHFSVAFNGPSWTDPDLITLMVMEFMIGDYRKCSGSSAMDTSSALVERLRTSEIAEKLTTFTYNYRDAGLFGFHAIAKNICELQLQGVYFNESVECARAVMPDCLDVLAHSIMYEVTQLCYKVSIDDVAHACDQLKSSLLRRANDTEDAADDIGNQLLAYGRKISYAELCARIDVVDAKTVKRAANRFIFDKDLAMVAIGPVQDLPNYDWFRRRTCWNKT